MNQAVFISDLHLCETQSAITARYHQFIDWALVNTQSLYILGDFFNLWAGDDTRDEYFDTIIASLVQFKERGVKLYFMPGNRDFLLGQYFYEKTGAIFLEDPSVIMLDNKPILLAHGDRYCTNDEKHQKFRAITRHPSFASFFCRTPKKLRNFLAHQVRNKSMRRKDLSLAQMDAVPDIFVNEMSQVGVNILIHGHTHRPGLSEHQHSQQTYRRYVLSDWDSLPQFLCFNAKKGFYYHSLTA